MFSISKKSCCTHQCCFQDRRHSEEVAPRLWFILLYVQQLPKPGPPLHRAFLKSHSSAVHRAHTSPHSIPSSRSPEIKTSLQKKKKHTHTKKICFLSTWDCWPTTELRDFIRTIQNVFWESMQNIKNLALKETVRVVKSWKFELSIWKLKHNLVSTLKIGYFKRMAHRLSAIISIQYYISPYLVSIQDLQRCLSGNHRKVRTKPQSPVVVFDGSSSSSAEETNGEESSRSSSSMWLLQFKAVASPACLDTSTARGGSTLPALHRVKEHTSKTQQEEEQLLVYCYPLRDEKAFEFSSAGHEGHRYAPQRLFTHSHFRVC